MQIQVDAQTLEVEPGQVVLYRAGTTYSERAVATDPPKSLIITFDHPSIPVQVPLICTDHSLRVRQLMEWVFDEANASTDESLAGRTTGLLQAILDRLMYHEYHQMPEMVQRVREYIRIHVHEQVTLDDLAQNVGLTRYHFNRRYKELTGITPMAELRRSRLHKARYFLLHTDFTLREVANGVGFKDEFHLSRAFKKQFGIAPNHYRQQQRVQEPEDAT